MLDVNTYLANAALTATGQQTGVDMGADLVAQTYACHVTAVSGTGATMDGKIQESDDNSTWRDFLAFPQMTLAQGAQVQYVTGQSNARYRRFAYTIAGTTPSFTTIVAPVPAGRDKNY